MTIARRIGTWAVVAASILAAAPAPGADAAGRVAVGVRASSLGAGLDLTLGLARSLNLRLQGNAFQLSRTVNVSDIDYDADVRLASALALLDVHPGGGAFRISVGGGWSGNKATGSSPRSGPVVVNGVTYDAATVGHIEGEVKPKSYGLYAGLGFGNAVGEGSPVKAVFDVGVLYHGEPQVTLTPVPGTAGLPPGYVVDVSKERQEAQDEVSKYKFFPVVSLGISYRF